MMACSQRLVALRILTIGGRSTDSGFESRYYLSDDDYSLTTGSAFITGFIPEMFIFGFFFFSFLKVSSS